jgi:hypothetical protein
MIQRTGGIVDTSYNKYLKKMKDQTTIEYIRNKNPTRLIIAKSILIPSSKEK